MPEVFIIVWVAALLVVAMVAVSLADDFTRMMRATGGANLCEKCFLYHTDSSSRVCPGCKADRT